MKFFYDLSHWLISVNQKNFENNVVMFVGPFNPLNVMFCYELTHWGQVTHICVGNLTTIGSDNGLSPGRRQAIIWTNAGILLIGPLGTNFSEISIEILAFSFTKMRLKVSYAKCRPFCLGLNVLTLPFLTSDVWLLYSLSNSYSTNDVTVN